MVSSCCNYCQCSQEKSNGNYPFVVGNGGVDRG